MQETWESADGFGMIQARSIFTALFLFLVHQLHLRSSGIRSRRLGTSTRESTVHSKPIGPDDTEITKEEERTDSSLPWTKVMHVGDIRMFQPRCMILIEKQSFKQENEKNKQPTNSGLTWGSSGLLQKPVIKKPSTTLRELENSGLLRQRAQRS